MTDDPIRQDKAVTGPAFAASVPQEGFDFGDGPELFGPGLAAPPLWPGFSFTGCPTR